MKHLFVLMSFALAFTANAQINKASDNLFNLAAQDTKGKDAKKIEQENLDNYERFVLIDTNNHLYNPHASRDQGKRTSITKTQAQAIIQEAESNPVVALHQGRKYDKDQKGIGFCFGRAMFTHLFLTSAGVNRGNIKKAFIVGPMSNGAWAWHVSTIVQSSLNGKEVWYAIDPVAGTAMEVKAWYKHWKKSSDDQKLKLYIADAGKFGPSPSTYDERNKTNSFYNNYFNDMNEWFASQDLKNSIK